MKLGTTYFAEPDHMLGRNKTGLDQESLSSYRDQILQGDCLQILKKLPNASVDVVFADPPYNLQLRGKLRRPNDSLVKPCDAKWDAFDNFSAYDEFTAAWLSEARRILKPDGTLWVIGSYHNIYRVGSLIQDLGYWILNDVVWLKNNPMPNFKGRRLTNAHETLIWAARSEKSKYVFNYNAMRVSNDDLQLRSDWHFPICGGKERLRDEAGKKCHPTQKPKSLLYRVLMAASRPGDLILDPFFGTGTTGAVAKMLGRHYLGIEKDRQYIKLAHERIAAISPIKDTHLDVMHGKRACPRIPFGTLVEAGFVQPGKILYCPKKHHKAVVRVDGSLSCEQHAGSIHKVGALVQGRSACNGWTFWHFQNAGSFEPIDRLRELARQKPAASLPA